MNTAVILLFVISVLFLTACTTTNKNLNSEEKLSTGPIKVEIRHEQGKYVIYRGGQPYVIKGAGLNGDVKSLAAHGANSFRTWGTSNEFETGQQILDKALENGMTVAMGIWIHPERLGFDYDDSVQIQNQFKRVKEEVLALKDHPALLMWAIGNELNHQYTNPKVYDAVNAMSKMIHEVDPNHPTTTTTSSINMELANDIRNRAPDLDVLSIQLYADIVNLPRYIREIGWTGPYMVTEWGATGHWEVGSTPWGAPYEQNSSQKAKSYLTRYQNSIEPYLDQCIGNYVFLWGQKQERTPTWYGLFLSSGEETEPIDVMHYIWNGQWPTNRTPRIDSISLNGKAANDVIYLKAHQDYPAIAMAFDYEGDSLSYKWEIMHESTDLKEGGDFEETPETVAGWVKNPRAQQIMITAPDKEGAYRLFVYVFDKKGHAAHANIPFYVKL